jgi:hypothetical protein
MAELKLNSERAATNCERAVEHILYTKEDVMTIKAAVINTPTQKEIDSDRQDIAQAIGLSKRN